MPVNDELGSCAENNIVEEILTILNQYDSDDLKRYIDIINNALQQKRQKLKKTDTNYVYYEGHHILPKSLFKDFTNNKNNIVLLTPSEHFECHKLLTKIFPSPEMTFAYLLMSNKHQLSTKEYNKLRREYAFSISKKLKGVSKTYEHKIHISEGRMGLSYGPLSEEHKQKISQALIGTTPSDTNRKVCSERCKKRVGSKNTQSKKVECIEDNLIFDTVHQCEEYYGILHLYRYCSTGKAHSKLNKHFKYVQEDEDGQQ